MRKRVFLIALVVAVAGVMVFGGTAFAGKPKYSTPVEATLTGAAEVPGPGDEDGSGNAHMSLYPTKYKICYRLTVENITPPATAAHLHEGGVNEDGPVRLGLKAPGSDGTARECIRGLSMKFIRKIKRNPEDYYVNVHNSKFSDGAVRGQLFKP